VRVGPVILVSKAAAPADLDKPEMWGSQGKKQDVAMGWMRDRRRDWCSR
jgi:hypothetical protein